MKKLYYIIACLFLVLIIFLVPVSAEEGDWEWYSGDVVEVSGEKNLCLFSADFSINGIGRRCKGYFLEISEGILGEPKLIFKYELDNELNLIGYPLISDIVVVLDETKSIPTVQFLYDPLERFDSEGYYIIKPVLVVIRIAPSLYKKTWCLRPIQIVEDNKIKQVFSKR